MRVAHAGLKRPGVIGSASAPLLELKSRTRQCRRMKETSRYGRHGANVCHKQAERILPVLAQIWRAELVQNVEDTSKDSLTSVCRRPQPKTRVCAGRDKSIAWARSSGRTHLRIVDTAYAARLLRRLAFLAMKAASKAAGQHEGLAATERTAERGSDHVRDEHIANCTRAPGETPRVSVHLRGVEESSIPPSMPHARNRSGWMGTGANASAGPQLVKHALASACLSYNRIYMNDEEGMYAQTQAEKVLLGCTAYHQLTQMNTSGATHSDSSEARRTQRMMHRSPRVGSPDRGY
jgi:hypothetical protein